LGDCEDAAADAGREPNVGAPEEGSGFIGMDGGIETRLVIWNKECL